MTDARSDALDLAALMCSRVCHDVIGPVGAILNGLELLEFEKDPGMREEAIKLVHESTRKASARLEFSRLAFGAAGSAGASVDLGDAEGLARGVVEDERVRLVWNPARRLLPKNVVKFALNLVAIARQSVLTTGSLTLDVEGPDEALVITVRATGPRVRPPRGAVEHLTGDASHELDAHGVQAFYAGRLAASAGLAVTVEPDGEDLVFRAAAAAGAPAGV
jgi:histidine phosphotransferase ChpT